MPTTPEQQYFREHSFLLHQAARCPSCGTLLRFNKPWEGNRTWVEGWSDGWQFRWPQNAALLVRCASCQAAIWLDALEDLQLEPERVLVDKYCTAIEPRAEKIEFLRLGIDLPRGPKPERADAGAQYTFPFPPRSWDGFTEKDRRQAQCRTYLARRLLWRDNNRYRNPSPIQEFVRSENPPLVQDVTQDAPALTWPERVQCLYALIEASWTLNDGSDERRLELAEWLREARQWDQAKQVLERPFAAEALEDIATQMRVLVNLMVPWPVELVFTIGRRAKLRAEQEANNARIRAAKAKELAAIRSGHAPDRLLELVLQAGGSRPADDVLQRGLPPSMAMILGATRKKYNWEAASLLAGLCQVVIQTCGAPDGKEFSELSELVSAPVDGRLKEYLTAALRGTTWGEWRYSPAGLQPPSY